MGLAVMHRASGDAETAQEHDRQALLLLPPVPGTGHERLRLLALIRACRHAGSGVAAGEAAVAYMREARLENDPLAVDAWRQVATCYSRARRPDDAIAALQEATGAAERTNQPIEIMAQISSDEAAWLMRARRDDEAVSAGTRALAMVPEADKPTSDACRRASVTLGEVAYRRADHAGAEAHFARASRWSRAEPGDGSITTRNAMRWHARALQELGRFDEAAALYERLLQLVPPHQEKADLGVWWVRFRYGATLLGQGREQEAERQLRLAVSKGRRSRAESGDADADAELGAQVSTARAALLAHRLHFTPELKTTLGDLAWLVDFTGAPPDDAADAPDSSAPRDTP